MPLAPLIKNIWISMYRLFDELITKDTKTIKRFYQLANFDWNLMKIDKYSLF